jgi:hypothetical protein
MELPSSLWVVAAPKPRRLARGNPVRAMRLSGVRQTVTCPKLTENAPMNAIIYLVGLVVIVLAVLALLGLR